MTFAMHRDLFCNNIRVPHIQHISTIAESKVAKNTPVTTSSSSSVVFYSPVPKIYWYPLQTTLETLALKLRQSNVGNEDQAMTSRQKLTKQWGDVSF